MLVPTLSDNRSFGSGQNAGQKVGREWTAPATKEDQMPVGAAEVVRAGVEARNPGRSAPVLVLPNRSASWAHPLQGSPFQAPVKSEGGHPVRGVQENGLCSRGWIPVICPFNGWQITPLLDGNSEHFFERAGSGRIQRNSMDGGGYDRAAKRRPRWKTGRRRRWTWGCRTWRKRRFQSLGRGADAALAGAVRR